jgi:hypothetical protein
MIVIALAATVAKLKGWEPDPYWDAVRDEQGRLVRPDIPAGVGTTVAEITAELVKRGETLSDD